jgi:hypothetical protein
MPTNSEKMARRDLDLYKQAVQRYGRVVTPMLNDVPRALAFSHLLRVNPELSSSPEITWDQRKGFLRVTHDATAQTGISWETAEEISNNAYIWGWDLNTAGPIFQRANPSFFKTPTADFWKCLYTQHALGPRVFDFIWKRRNTNVESQFDAVVAAMLAWGKHIAGWSYTRLKHTLMVELPYVFAVAAINGSLVSKGFGLRPVLSESRMRRTLIGKQ